MRKYIYSYYDKVQEAFTQPLYQDLDPIQMEQGLTRALIKGFKVEQLSQFAGLDLYSLGTFEDTTGEFILEKVKLLDCDVVLAVREQNNVSKEVVKKEGDK